MGKIRQKVNLFDFHTIRWRITLVILVVIIFHIATILWITRQVHINATQAALEKVKGDLQMGEALLDAHYPGDWMLENGKLCKGNVCMNNNNLIVDKIGRMTGNTCTVFQGDVRIATNIMRDGSRAIGTKVSKEVAQVVLGEGREYWGEAEVVGIKYQTAYKPIKDSAGKNIGIFYMGANKQYVDSLFRNCLWNVGATFYLNLLMIVSVVWVLTKSLVRPVRELVHSANRLARGDLDTKIVVKAQDEIGYIAKAIERMRKERKRSEEKLRSAHQQLLNIIEFLPDATFVIDQDRRVIAWNRAVEEMSGVGKEEIIGKGDYAYAKAFYNEARPILIDLFFFDYPEIRGKYNYIKNKEKTLFAEIFFPERGDEEGTYWWATASPLFNDEGKLVGAIESIRDITEQKVNEKRLEYLATHDSLTSIPNRFFLEETLKRAVARAKRGRKSALLLIDLDNFKMVNDTLGHDAGDRLLLSLTGILRNNLREEDFLARLGGDEFAVLLEGAAAEEAMVVAEKLRRVIDESELCLVMYRSCFNVSLSICITLVEGDMPPSRILALADTALYKAKEGGRNRIAFLRNGEDETSHFSETNQMVTLIKGALKENRFVLYFQPVVSIEGGHIIHYEVLVRMKDTEGELIFPNRFIPVAERFGLMPQIDRWVVESSLKVLARSPDKKLFINLSGVSLGDEDLLQFIKQAVGENNIDPSRIGFEITETAAVKDLSRAENWISELRKIGCRFSLDDFGIGFSSFYYLKILPVDYIKIDGSFIRNVHQENTHSALVQAINTVAQTLSKKTVAEFVENEEDLKKLQELKVDYAQGYYLGRPEPEECGDAPGSKKPLKDH